MLNKQFVMEVDRLDTFAQQSFQDDAGSILLGIYSMLCNKNRKYGDSALNPVRIFSKADAAEQIRVRLDDKLSRLRSAQGDEDEDVMLDLIGYLILERIAAKRKGS